MKKICKIMFAMGIALTFGLGLTGCKKSEPTAGEQLDNAIEQTDKAADEAADDAGKAMEDAGKALQD